MDLTIGTFNLNNLLTRRNFQAEVAGNATLEETLEFRPDSERRLRKFKGRVVTGKDQNDRTAIAERIAAMNVDVLAVREVENIEALRTFNAEDLNGIYPHLVLSEGNDLRLIDVALMSKLRVANSAKPGAQQKKLKQGSFRWNQLDRKAARLMKQHNKRAKNLAKKPLWKLDNE